MAEEKRSFVGGVQDPVAKTILIITIVLFSITATGLALSVAWGVYKRAKYGDKPTRRWYGQNQNRDLEAGLRPLEIVSRTAAGGSSSMTTTTTTTEPFPAFNPRFPGAQRSQSSSSRRVNKLRRQISVTDRPRTGESWKPEQAFDANYQAYASYAEHGAKAPPQKPSKARVLTDTRHSVEI